MFERLPKPIFYKIFEEFESKDIHRLMSVSRFFNSRLKSDECWNPRLDKVIKRFQKRHEGVNDLDASLAAAAYLGLIHHVEMFIKKKANVNVKLYFYKDRDMYITPLHLAAFSGNLTCIKLLVNNKAEILPHQTFQDTPLHWAVSGGSVICAKYFLDKGVPIEHESGFSPLGWNWTAIQIASSAGRPKCVELLIEHGANIHHQDPDQYQAIHRAASSGNAECVRLLAQHKADVNAYNEDGKTPLCIAVRNKRASCVRELLIQGVNPRHANWLDRFELPLQKAIENKDFETAKILLEFDPTLIDEIYRQDGAKFPMGDRPALHIAAARGNVRAVQFLLQYNPDPTIECHEGKNALAYAIESENEECIEIVKNYFDSWQMPYSPIM